ncbi:MAG: S-layer homology domain-containing protein [Armatimonadota bacterium]|nr:MAG: S-layer homology domain-containing protein [Armatimonadota bacterium]
MLGLGGESMSCEKRAKALVILVALAVVVALASAATAVVPGRLYVIDKAKLGSATENREMWLLLQSLQGILVKNAVYAEEHGEEGNDYSAIWISGEINPGLLEYITEQYPIHDEQKHDAWDLVRQFHEGNVEGYIPCYAYSPGRSLNVAASASGLRKGLVAATPEFEQILSEWPYLLSEICNAKPRTEWCLVHGTCACPCDWPPPEEQLTQDLLIEQSLSITGKTGPMNNVGDGLTHLRDLSASRAAFTYKDDSSGLRSTAMGATDPHSYVVGYPALAAPTTEEERQWIRDGSLRQHPVVRAEKCHNLSVLSELGRTRTYNQGATSHTGPVTVRNDRHYVCIVMDGGWDVGWTLNQFHQPNWFGNRHRDMFEMNWEISPALLDLAPPALGYYYSLATDKDFFVSSASGYGMLYPEQYPYLDQYAAHLGPKVKQADLRIVNVMGEMQRIQEPEETEEEYAQRCFVSAIPFLDRCEVLGVFYKTQDDCYTGIEPGNYMVWNGKVIWPYRYSLWNVGEPGHTVDDIANAIRNDQENHPRGPASNPLSYSLIAVYPLNPWDGDLGGSTIMDEVYRLVDRLATATGVQIVSAEEFTFLLRATFPPEEDRWNGPVFPDVPTTHWAWEHVEALVEQDIVDGYKDGMYHPEYLVDRAQMAVFIARALAGGEENVPDPDPDCTEPPFPDVNSEDWGWACKHIRYLKQNNIVEGYKDGSYGPAAIVNRAEMAVFIARSIVHPPGEDSVPDPPVEEPTFLDVLPEFWAYNHIEYLAAQGITEGYGDGRYHPEYLVTRGQMAVYVGRAFGLACM